MLEITVKTQDLPVGVVNDQFTSLLTTVASCPEGGILVVLPCLAQFEHDAAEARECEDTPSEADLSEEALCLLLTARLGDTWRGQFVHINVQ